MATLTRTMTHAQLMTAIAVGALNKGESITISDYSTKHNFLDGAIVISDVNTGQIEPLTITAISNNKLHFLAYSQLYPFDLIHYDPYDDLCEDGVTARKGKITKRINLVNRTGAECYDFRNLKYRRWAIDVANITEWNDAAYAKGEVVNYIGYIAVARRNIEALSGETPDFSPNFWHVLFNLNDESVYQAYNTGYIRFGKNEDDFLNCQIPVDATNYRDFYTFNGSNSTAVELSSQVFDTVIGTTLPGKKYNNIVFLGNNGGMPQRNSFKSCGLATIGVDCKNNSFGEEMEGNIISYGFEGNVADVGFKNNLVKEEATHNQFGPYATQNYLGPRYYDNITGSFYSGNFSGDTTEDNVFGSGAHGFDTAGSMLENTFGSPSKVVANAGFANNVVHGGSEVLCNADNCIQFIISPKIEVDLTNYSRTALSVTKTVVKNKYGAIKIAFCGAVNSYEFEDATD